MKKYNWNEEIEYKFRNSYTGAIETNTGTLKGMLENPNIGNQDKISAMCAVLVELIEKIEHAEEIDEFSGIIGEII